MVGGLEVLGVEVSALSDKSRLAAAAATAAETAVLKLEVEEGSGPSRSWKNKQESIHYTVEICL